MSIKTEGENDDWAGSGEGRGVVQKGLGGKKMNVVEKKA